MCTSGHIFQAVPCGGLTGKLLLRTWRARTVVSLGLQVPVTPELDNLREPPQPCSAVTKWGQLNLLPYWEGPKLLVEEMPSGFALWTLTAVGRVQGPTSFLLVGAVLSSGP